MPFEIVKTKQHVCMHSYSCVTQTTINVCIVCVSACICLWTGQMGKRDEQSPKKRMIAEKKKRGGKIGREGTWSGNASVPLWPATSYHGASTDR